MKRPYEVFQRSVVNQSARNGIPLLIVIHCTEGQNMPGVSDLRNLGDWFDNPAAQCSAHVGVDAEGHSAMYVRDSRKAWHVAEFNSSALGIEMIVAL
jgi:N-acetyl-anhydromuramyl-L-alanine amidase AmpD